MPPSTTHANTSHNQLKHGEKKVVAQAKVRLYRKSAVIMDLVHHLQLWSDRKEKDLNKDRADADKKRFYGKDVSFAHFGQFLYDLSHQEIALDMDKLPVLPANLCFVDEGKNVITVNCNMTNSLSFASLFSRETFNHFDAKYCCVCII